MWTFISLLLFLLYIIYRRRQNKSNEERRPSYEEPVRSRESSEYRLSVVQSLPTIVEENPATLTPSNSNHNFPPLLTTTSTTSPLAIGKTKKFYVTSYELKH
jgi:hypothetical protein